MNGILKRVFGIILTLFLIFIIFMECCLIPITYFLFVDIFIYSTKLDKKFKLLAY